MSKILNFTKAFVVLYLKKTQTNVLSGFFEGTDGGFALLVRGSATRWKREVSSRKTHLHSNRCCFILEHET